MSKYERKGIEKKNHKDFEKNMNKKIRNFSGKFPENRTNQKNSTVFLV